jgi:hypothetical protein
VALQARNAQDAASVARGVWEGGLIAAGSAGQSTKFVAHAAMLLFSLNVYTNVAGTSTYTYTVNGTTTVGVAAQQVSVIRVYNTASAGSSVSLATATLGPFVLGGQFVTSGTLTNQVGAYSQFALNTNSGTSGYGGIPINAGDYCYVVTGTDATGTETVAIDWQHPQNVALTV